MLFDHAIEFLPHIISWQRSQAFSQAARKELQRYIEAQEHIVSTLQETTFYELAKSACSLIYEANLNPIAVASAFPDLRFPSQRAWIEFDSEMRYLACEQAGQVAPEREGNQPSRMAFLVECDSEDCRKGSIFRFVNFKHSVAGESSSWQRIGLKSAEQLVQLDRVVFRFDFDSEPVRYTKEQIKELRNQIQHSRAETLERRSKQGLATPFDKLLDQDDEAIIRCAHMGNCFKPHSFGSDSSELVNQLGNWIGEQPFLINFLALLLTDVVETEKNDLMKINKARMKKGKPELRDYIVIRLKRGTKVYEKTGETNKLNRQGTPRRLHPVSGHLRHQPTKTGTKLIWIAPHSRGKHDDNQRYKVI